MTENPSSKKDKILEIHLIKNVQIYEENFKL